MRYIIVQDPPEWGKGWFVIDEQQRQNIAEEVTEAEASIIAWALNQIADGRIITALVSPAKAELGRPRYAGFYCEDYTGPTEGVAP